MPEKIEKPMAKASIQEKVEKEKRQREPSPEYPQQTELSKRRELEFRPDDDDKVSSAVTDSVPQQSGFLSAKGFGGIQSSVNIFDEPTAASSTTEIPGPETSGQTAKDSVAVGSSEKPKDTVSSGGFASAAGFRSFANTSAFSSANKSTGFSSLLATSDKGESGFSSLLDPDQKNGSFDKKPVNVLDAEADVGDEDQDGDNIEQPTIDEEQYVAVKGLEKTTIPTGEEGERCLHSIRAKLYAIDPRNVDAGWKERGVGTLRVLEDELKRTRLVMRADAVLRVILNMPLRSQYKLEDGGDSMGEKTIRVFGIEDGMSIWLALRVGSQKAAQETKLILEDCIKNAPIQAHATSQAESNSTNKSASSSEAEAKESDKEEGTQTVEAADAVEATELSNEKEIEKEKESFEESKPIK